PTPKTPQAATIPNVEIRQKISIFDGSEDSYWWVLCVEKFFKEQRTPNALKLTTAVMTLKGRAHQWWLWRSRRQPPITTWEAFTTVFLWRFKHEWREILPIEGEEEEEDKPTENEEPAATIQKTSSKNEISEKPVESEAIISQNLTSSINKIMRIEEFSMASPQLPAPSPPPLPPVPPQKPPDLRPKTIHSPPVLPPPLKPPVNVLSPSPASPPPPPKPPDISMYRKEEFFAAEVTIIGKLTVISSDVNFAPPPPPKLPDLLSPESIVPAHPASPPPPAKPPDQHLQPEFLTPALPPPPKPPDRYFLRSNVKSHLSVKKIQLQMSWYFRTVRSILHHDQQNFFPPSDQFSAFRVESRPLKENTIRVIPNHSTIRRHVYSNSNMVDTCSHQKSGYRRVFGTITTLL
ncbi:swarming motility protein ybiA, partial [Trifolium medium]|nr:swarming motility protein ybiA [Trifolium medium]